MFDIGWSELLVIGIVALVVIGPKELPGVVRMIAQNLAKLRKMAAEFQGQFTDAKPQAGTHYYYLRVMQTDDELAWASPIWVKR